MMGWSSGGQFLIAVHFYFQPPEDATSYKLGISSAKHTNYEAHESEIYHFKITYNTIIEANTEAIL